MGNELTKTEKMPELTADEKARSLENIRRVQNRHVLVSKTKEDGTQQVSLSLEPSKGALTLLQAFGTLDAAVINTHLTYLQNIVSLGKGDALANNIVAMLYGLSPKNEVESLLAAQIVATNHVAMRMLSRSLDSQELEGANHYTNRAHKAQSLLIRQLELYHSIRQGGQTTQKVIVEKVEVNSGGQAIVGAVAGGGANKTKGEG